VAVAPAAVQQQAGTPQYTIKAVVGHQFRDSAWWFQVHWVGSWGRLQKTWEPLANFTQSGRLAIGRYIRGLRKLLRCSAGEVKNTPLVPPHVLSQGVFEGVGRRLNSSAWGSLKAEARLSRAAVLGGPVPMRLKELLPGRFSAPINATEMQRLMGDFQRRQGPGEKVLRTGIAPFEIT
jgi:hypothetical protein